MKTNKSRLRRISFVVGSAALLGFGMAAVHAQEVEKGTLYGDMSTVTQDNLTRAASDGNRTRLGPMRSGSQPRRILITIAAPL